MGSDLTPDQQKWARLNHSGRSDEMSWEEKSDSAADAQAEALKDIFKAEHKHEQNFEGLLEKSEKPLIRVRAVFPFDFFPDELTVDVSKVNFIHKELLSKRVQSIYIRNISDVVVNTGIFFANLGIIDFGFAGNSINVNYLKNNEALKVRRIIQGLVVCARQGIDITQFEAEHFKYKIELLGEEKVEDLSGSLPVK